RTDAVLAGEVIASEAGAVLDGLRDVVACGAQDRAIADVGTAIDAQARASRAVAWAGSLRVAVVALGYYLPLILLLSTAPWLTRHGGLTSGQIIGAVTYLTGSLWPALNSLVGSVGSWGIQLGAVLRRLNEACAATAAEACARPAAGPGQATATPIGSELRISG